MIPDNEGVNPLGYRANDHVGFHVVVPNVLENILPISIFDQGLQFIISSANNET